VKAEVNIQQGRTCTAEYFWYAHDNFESSLGRHGGLDSYEAAPVGSQEVKGK
jgi:hypothetical protein